MPTSSPINVLFLSNTPTLAGTARILQYWLHLGQPHGLRGHVVVQEGSEFVQWGRERQVAVYVDAMPWPNRRRPWESLWHAAKVAWWARQRGVDIIHCNEHDVYPFAMLVKRWLRCPIVCHIRYRLERGFTEWAFGARRAPDALLWTSYQQKADSADAVAGLIPEEHQHMFRLGVDLASFGALSHTRASARARWGVEPDDLLIGTASPLRPRKRVEDFIALIRYLAERHPRVVGLIAGGIVVGDEAYRQHIEQLIASSGLGRRLQWLGYLEPVEPFYHACDIVVSTSEYETFGNSICEAMACGKPVVGYHGGAVAEVVGEAGVIVQTGDLAALTTATERLVEDAALRTMLGTQGYHRVVSEFDPSVSLMRLLALYRTLLAARG